MNELAIWLNKDKDALLQGEKALLILEHLRDQVAKDFSLSHQEIHPTLDDIKQAIGHAAQTLWTSQDTALKQLLYTIDIDEGRLLQQLSGKSMSEQITQLTDVILQREMRKVLTKLYFSGKLD